MVPNLSSEGQEGTWGNYFGVTRMSYELLLFALFTISFRHSTAAAAPGQISIPPPSFVASAATTPAYPHSAVV